MVLAGAQGSGARTPTASLSVHEYPLHVATRARSGLRPLRHHVDDRTLRWDAVAAGFRAQGASSRRPALAEVLGHARVATTARYLQALENERAPVTVDPWAGCPHAA